jgi:hypothetical protein
MRLEVIAVSHDDGATADLMPVFLLTIFLADERKISSMLLAAVNLQTRELY